MFQNLRAVYLELLQKRKEIKCPLHRFYVNFPYHSLGGLFSTMRNTSTGQSMATLNASGFTPSRSYTNISTSFRDLPSSSKPFFWKESHEAFCKFNSKQLIEKQISNNEEIRGAPRLPSHTVLEFSNKRYQVEVHWCTMTRHHGTVNPNKKNKHHSILEFHCILSTCVLSHLCTTTSSRFIQNYECSPSLLLPFFSAVNMFKSRSPVRKNVCTSFVNKIGTHWCKTFLDLQRPAKIWKPNIQKP